MNETERERLHRLWIVAATGDVEREVEVEFAPNAKVAGLGLGETTGSGACS